MRILAALSRAEGKRVLDLCWRHLYLEPELIPWATRFDHGIEVTHEEAAVKAGRRPPEGFVLTAGAACQPVRQPTMVADLRQGVLDALAVLTQRYCDMDGELRRRMCGQRGRLHLWRQRHQGLHVGRQIGIRSPPDVRSLNFCVALVLA